MRRVSGPKQAIAPSGPPPWARWKGSRSNRIMRLIGMLPTPSGHGAGGPFRLARWQRSLITEVFDGYVIAAMVQLAAGNGKTTLMGAIGAAHVTADVTDDRHEAVAVSRKLDQARKCWDAARWMIEHHPELERRCTVYTSRNELRIVGPGEQEFRAIATGSVDDLQGENPSLALIDEIGFLPEGVWEAMVARAGKRPHPLYLGMGTPGFDQGTMLKLRSDHLKVPIPGFLYLDMSPPLDCRIDDPRGWRKANPMLREGLMNPNTLRTALRMMTENEFRLYHLAQFTGGANPYLKPGAWENLGVRDAPHDGAPVVLGFDGSDTTDWSALVGCTVVPPPPPPPGEKATAGERAAHTEAVARHRLEHPRHLFVVKLWNPETYGGRIPRRDVLDTIHQAFARWQVLGLAGDPFGWATELDDLALTYPERIERWPTTRARVGIAADRFRGEVLEGSVTHDGNPVLAKHLANMQAELTVDGPWLTRKNTTEPIDAGISALIAHDKAARTTPPPPRPRLALL